MVDIRTEIWSLVKRVCQNAKYDTNGYRNRGGAFKIRKPPTNAMTAFIDAITQQLFEEMS